MEINLQKTTYSKDFDKIINTSFSQLIQPEVESTDVGPTVSQFFQDYQTLFYQIPKEGDTESHRYLINTSSEYLGLSEVDIQALLNEITALRQSLLDANEQINTLLTSTPVTPKITLKAVQVAPASTILSKLKL